MVSERSDKAVLVLIGNKADMSDQRQVSYDEGAAKANHYNALFMETSALAGSNVKQLFKKIAQSLPGIETASSPKDEHNPRT